MSPIKETGYKCWQGYRGKGTLVLCWWECKLVQSLWKTVWKPLEKTELAHDPVIPLMDINTKEITVLRRYLYPHVHWSIICSSKLWKQPKCPLMDKQIRKMWCIYIQWNITLPWKRRKFCHLRQQWWNWRALYQVKKNRQINAVWYHLYVKCKKQKTHRNSSAMVARSSGLREMKRYWSKGINFKS